MRKGYFKHSGIFGCLICAYYKRKERKTGKCYDLDKLNNLGEKRT